VEFEISGKLIVNDEIDHQEMLDKFYKLLLESGLFYFVGVTKEIKLK
jgi:hypothetical protein